MKRILILLLPLFSTVALAEACLDWEGNNLRVDNQAVINMKYNTRNGHKTRARVKGVIGKTYPATAGHIRFQVLLGNDEGIELVYNTGFDALPQKLKEGVEVEACGDYITASEQGKYPPSPDKAIIHWLHRSTSDHPSGWVKIGKKLYGKGAGENHFTLRGSEEDEP